MPLPRRWVVERTFGWLNYSARMKKQKTLRADVGLIRMRNASRRVTTEWNPPLRTRNCKGISRWAGGWSVKLARPQINVG